VLTSPTKRNEQRSDNRFSDIHSVAIEHRLAPIGQFFFTVVCCRQYSESLLCMKARRTFLLHCSTIAVGAFVLPSAAWATPGLLRGGPAPISFAQFEKNLNTSFTVVREGGRKVMLKLVEAQVATQRNSSKAARRGGDEGNEKFSLIFRGPRGQLLPQDNYRFRHSELGELSLFIVPVLSRNQRHYIYQAIFNRPRGVKTTLV
jgi:hypothetical protein